MLVATIKIIENINVVANMHIDSYIQNCITVHGQIKGGYHELHHVTLLVVMYCKPCV